MRRWSENLGYYQPASGNSVPIQGWQELERTPYQTPAWMRRQGDELDLTKKRMGLGLLGQLSRSMGDFSYSKQPAFAIPQPGYVGTGGVYNQGQIDAMSNLQRGNLQQQAGTATNNFAASLGARGFSPMGTPLLDFYGQSAMMRANAGAARNETPICTDRIPTPSPVWPTCRCAARHRASHRNSICSGCSWANWGNDHAAARRYSPGRCRGRGSPPP